MNGEIKKWKISLLLFYEYFRERHASVSVSDLFYYGRSTLRRYNILTEKSLRHHASILAGRHYLHTVKNRRKPFNYSVPYQFLISRSGLERLTFENLISQHDQEQLVPYIYSEALENGIKVRER